MTSNILHKSIMPWEELPSIKRKLNIMIILGLIFVLLMYIIIPKIKLPEKEVKGIPKRFAQLIIEKELRVTFPLLIPEKEQLKQEQLKQEQLKQEQLKQEQLKQEQLKQEQLKQEQLKQEQLKQEQLKQEQLKQEQLKQEQLKQEQLKQEQLKQEQLKQEQLKQEQLKQEQLKQEDFPKDIVEIEKPKQTIEEAKIVAQPSSLMTFSDTLAAMRNTLFVQKSSSVNIILEKDVQRKVYNSSDLNIDLTTGSGGVDIAKYASNAAVTSVNLDARSKDKVTGSKIKASASDRIKHTSDSLGGRSKNAVSDSKIKASGIASSPIKVKLSSRSNEQIYLANLRIIKALNYIYNKARLHDPDLKGRLTFKVSVNTSGAVTLVEIIYSTIESTLLKAQLKSRLKLVANYGEGIAEVLEFNIVFTE